MGKDSYRPDFRIGKIIEDLKSSWNLPKNQDELIADKRNV